MENKNTVRVTKAQKLEAIKAALSPDFRKVFPAPADSDRVDYILDYDAAVAFLDAEIALLSKKNSNDKSQTELEKVNAGLREKIVDFLSEKPDNVTGYTCTDIWKAVPAIQEVGSVNKVTSLIKTLKLNGMVGETTEKGKKLFYLL